MPEGPFGKTESMPCAVRVVCPVANDIFSDSLRVLCLYHVVQMHIYVRIFGLVLEAGYRVDSASVSSS